MNKYANNIGRLKIVVVVLLALLAMLLAFGGLQGESAFADTPVATYVNGEVTFEIASDGGNGVAKNDGKLANGNDVTAGDSDGLTWTAVSASSDISGAGNYYLSDDVTLTGTKFFTSGTTNLALNGYVIKGSGSSCVIRINSSSTTLNLYGDGNSYTYDNETSDTDDDIAYTGGLITGGSGNYGGGVYVDGGTFNMNGGTIAGNEVHSTMMPGPMPTPTPAYGGGVYVGGTFNMNGGEISGNSTDMSGGGVYVLSGKTFSMSGGSITGNSADQGGGIYSGEPVKVSGNVNISGNTKAVGTTKNNVVLASGKKIIIDGELTNTASIGITMYTNGEFAQLEDGSTLTMANYKDNFVADDSTKAVALGSSGDTLELVAKPVEVATMVDEYGCEVSVWNSGLVEYTFGGKTFDNSGETGKTPTNVTVDVDGVSTDITSHINELLGTWTAVPSAGGEITTAGNYYIADDMSLADFVNNIKISADVNLALNGKVIVGKVDTCITVNSSGILNLYGDGNSYTYDNGTSGDDSDDIAYTGGLITGGSSGDGTGGIKVNGTLNMNGGTIAGNSGYYAGGVYVTDGAYFTMNGGSITGNSGDNVGGVDADGEFTMNGGSITGNSGTGVNIAYDAEFYISGSPVIDNNTDLQGLKHNVVFVSDANGICVIGELKEGAKIGIKAISDGSSSNVELDELYVGINLVVGVGYDISSDDIKYFTIDDDGYGLEYAEHNSIKYLDGCKKVASGGSFSPIVRPTTTPEPETTPEPSVTPVEPVVKPIPEPSVTPTEPVESGSGMSWLWIVVAVGGVGGVAGAVMAVKGRRK